MHGNGACLQPKATQSGPFVGRVKKIFIGGVASWTTKTDIMDYFSTYGKVCHRNRGGGRGGYRDYS